MKTYKKRLEMMIRGQLLKTEDHCPFKKAYLKLFVPKGWVIVSLKDFPKCIAEILADVKRH